MFKPINTIHTNLVLKAPKDWDAEKNGECIGLPIHCSATSFYSWWAVDWKSRIKILFGRPIRLIVRSPSHPPVCIDAE